MRKEELQKLKDKLITEKKRLIQELDKREKNSLGKSMKDSSGEISSYRIHIADLASDTLEKDTSLDLLSFEENTLIKIQRALKRIEKGTYGKCLVCKKNINPKRLNAIPYAELCHQCQKKEERS